MANPVEASAPVAALAPDNAPPHVPPLPENPVLGTSHVGPGVTGQSDLGPGLVGQGGSVRGGFAGTDGVFGIALTNGVHGEGLGAAGVGVFGENKAGGRGVLGTSVSGTGVEARSQSGTALSAFSTSGGGIVAGTDTGIAVAGLSTSGTAVQGISGPLVGPGATTGDGVVGIGKNGVHGQSASPTDSGVWGENTGSGYGVSGSSAQGNGVWGFSHGAGVGVFGSSQNGDGVFGNSQKNGVHGLTASTGDAGVWGENTGLGVGVRGVSHNGDGVNGNAQSAAQSGVFGINLAGGSVPDNLNPPRPGGNGVWGHTTVEKGSGVVGSVDSNLQNAAGVTGIGKIAGQFFGDVHVSGDVLLTGGDCAERFDIVDSDEIVPGTVMVIETGSSLGISKSAYDKRVAGVVSGAGDFRPGLILGNKDSQDKRLPLALLGRVCCKVDANYCPIEIGDLLTTSPTPGHAMKAADPLKAFGTVIGKALHPLESGHGLIPILVALQ